MRILLISSYIFGYMDFAVEEMQRQGHEVEVFYYEQEPLSFSYKNIGHKITAGMGKLFGRNAKTKSRENSLKAELRDESFDYTLIIHGQYLNHETHVFLKSISRRYVAYFFDSIKKMPAQKKIMHHFDKVFSYEPEDCQKYGFEFITNFIPTTNYTSIVSGFKVFHISTRDHRFSVLEKLATYFKQNAIPFHFILFTKSKNPVNHFEISPKKLDFKAIGKHIKESTCLVDIQRKDQKGLSFRPFEALGNQKKLITNHPEIQSYDFYHPNNILIIDENDIQIPAEFTQSGYHEVPEEIVGKYTLDHWVKTILK